MPDTGPADVHRLFRHRELGGLCLQALAKNGPQDTRELALHAMRAKGLDTGDAVLAKAVAPRVIHALRMQLKRGEIAGGGSRGQCRVWALAPLAPPHATLE